MTTQMDPTGEFFAPDDLSAMDGLHVPPSPTARRKSTSMSRPFLLALIAGVIGFVVTLALLASSADTVTVYAAADDAAAGQILDSTSWVEVDVEVGSPSADHGIVVGAQSDLVQIELLAPVAAGEPLRTSAVRQLAVGDRLVPDPIEHPVVPDGIPDDLRAGELVHVIGVLYSNSASNSFYLAVDVPVVALSSGDDGGAFGGRNDEVTVTLGLPNSSIGPGIDLVRYSSQGRITLVRPGELPPPSQIQIWHPGSSERQPGWTWVTIGSEDGS